MRRARALPALFALAAIGLAAATVGGCKCNRSSPTYYTPTAPPEPDTPTPWPTSSIRHGHAYVSQFVQGALYVAELYPGTQTGTPTPAPTFVMTVSPPGFAAMGEPFVQLATDESKNMLVEWTRRDSRLWVFDLSSSAIPSASALIPTSPSFGSSITVGKFAPPRGPLANRLILASSTPVAGQLQHYLFSGTAVAASGQLSFSKGVVDFAVSNDGMRLAILAFGSPYQLFVYDLLAGGGWALVGSAKNLPTSATAQSLAIHANSVLIYVPLDNSPEEIWYYNVITGRSGRAPRPGGAAIQCLADPSGRWLFYTGGQNTISAMDTTVTPPLPGLTLNVPTSSPLVFSMDFSPATRMLLLGDSGTTSPGPTAWLCDIGAYDASNGTAQPPFWRLEETGGSLPFSHVAFGR